MAVEETNRTQDIYNFLKSKQFDVYMPEQHDGDCLNPYVVVKYDGFAKHANYSTNTHQYSITCCVPKDKYSMLDSYVNDVVDAMLEMQPMIMPNGYASPSFYDDDLKAHTMSIEYKNYRKLKGGYFR